MNKINIQELSLESFRNFGTFSTFINPDRPHMGSFYRDMEILDTGVVGAVAFSGVKAVKRPLIISSLEHHSYTEEAIFPLDGDILVTVAAACRSEKIPADIPVDKLEVFRVPQHTMVVLNKGVWHCGPFAFGSDCVNIIVVSPERTYANDCFHYVFPEQDKVEIEVK